MIVSKGYGGLIVDTRNRGGYNGFQGASSDVVGAVISAIPAVIGLFGAKPPPEPIVAPPPPNNLPMLVGAGLGAAVLIGGFILLSRR